MPLERTFETGRISVMKGSRRVLVKVVLFQSRGRGHSEDDATPNFLKNSKRPISGLSNEISFGIGFILKGSLIFKNEKTEI